MRAAFTAVKGQYDKMNGAIQAKQRDMESKAFSLAKMNADKFTAAANKLGFSKKSFEAQMKTLTASQTAVQGELKTLSAAMNSLTNAADKKAQ